MVQGERPEQPSPNTLPGKTDWPGLGWRSVALGTILVMLVVLGFVLIWEIRDVLVLIFLGMLLATALRPVMHWLRVLRLTRHAAAFVVLLLVLVSAVAFLAAVIPTVITQAQLLAQQLPEWYSNLRDTLIDSPYRIVRQFGYSLQPSFAPATNQSYMDTAVTMLVNWLPGIAYGLFDIVVVVLFTYYWLLYRERSLRSVLLLLPPSQREASEVVWLQIEEKIGAFIRGQSLLALIMGVFCLIGFWLIDLPYALLVALAAGLLELIPFLGPIMTVIIAAAVGFSVSPALGLSAIVVGLIAQQLENTLLVPRIMDEAVGVSPVVTLLAIVGFAALFGIPGALLAIPLAAVAQVLFNAWLSHTGAAATEVNVQGRNLIARLRYETQNLVQDVRLRLRHKSDTSNSSSDEPEEDLERVLADLDSLLLQLEQDPA